MSIEVRRDDQISRCIIYARFFDGGIHTDRLLWDFGQSEADGLAHESAVLRRIAESESEVHRIGCKIAAKQNADRGFAPGNPKRRYYCGFRTARMGDLPSSDEEYRIYIASKPEDGEDAHVDVALEILVEGKAPRAQARTDAGLALAEHFDPPVSHRCDCDAADQDHPFARFGVDCLYRGLPETIRARMANDTPAQIGVLKTSSAA